jgi:predicted nucleic acid-binding protein
LIAVDTSSLVRAFDEESDPQSTRLRQMLRTARDRVYLPPAVITEMLSNPSLTEDTRAEVLSIPVLPVRLGYWQRTGALRADLLRNGHKAKLADCLIAQSCIDHDIPLITYDRDFRHFVRAGLQLA